MASATDYRRILREARRAQLQTTSENLNRLQRTFEAAAEAARAKLVDVPEYMLTSGGALQQAFIGQVVHSLDLIIMDLARDFPQLLDAGMLESAQRAADREAAVEEMMAISGARDDRLQASLSRTISLTNGTEVGIRFGAVARDAVTALTHRYYADGLTLSDRLYNVTDAFRRTVEDTLVQAVASGTSAREVGRQLEETLTQAGADNARYQAMRIARTEISNAHREGHILSAREPGGGALKPYISAIGFRLSASHPEPDICDVWANHDSGLGPGNYLPDDVPSDHPHGGCFTLSVLTDFPQVSGHVKEPDPAAVPQSQIDYYAARGDAPAQAATAAAAGAVA